MKMLLLLCLRGNVFLYYGEELGLTQVEVPFADLRDPEAIANWPQTLSRDGATDADAVAGDAPYAGFSDRQAVAAGRRGPCRAGGGPAGRAIRHRCWR